MKLATYYKMRGDEVRFFKGDLNSFVIELYSEKLIEKFNAIDSIVDWNIHKSSISTYLRTGFSSEFNKLKTYSKNFGPSIEKWIKYYRKKYRTKKIDEVAQFDEICISTLFTFHFKITIETIIYCKSLLAKNGRIWIGGVMASVIPQEIQKETGINPIVGLLDVPKVIDSDNEIIIDELHPDYSILEEIEYEYPENNGYYAHMTRGCIRKCAFCAVPIIEPEFKDNFSLVEKVENINKNYGERRNLLLFDNNTLASDKFPQIIDEIQKAGFYKGATYVDPNLLSLSMRNLKRGINDIGYRKLFFKLVKRLSNKLHGKTKDDFFKMIENCGINMNVLPKKSQLIQLYPLISDINEEKLNKTPKKRYVDFNQGVDARLIDENIMKLLSKIPIYPLRIAFDNMNHAIDYEKAIRLANKYEIQHLSNYLLFNYKDRPEELYKRLKLNVDLCEELPDLKIYSFPMRYSPIWDDNGYHHNRKYVGMHWNKKFIRAIQCILNATKGKVGRKKSFFEAAFGKDEDEYFEILWMPERYIMNREKCINNGLKESWKILFYSLSPEEYREVKSDIESNKLKNTTKIYSSSKLNILKLHYQIRKEAILSNSIEAKEIISKSHQVMSSISLIG